MFDERQAQKDLRAYRRRGLKRDARRAVEFLRARGIEGATVLEVGGGIGAVQRELLDAGAARTVNVELSHGYESAAAELARGREDRVERRFGDFVEQPVEPADAVVLVRVVCCYPDAERMVGAAADGARRLLVLTYPPGNVVGRAIVAAGNLVLRLLGREFRAYAHPHRLICETAERHGLRQVYRGGGLVWRTAGFERAATMPT
jgi:magnesium-protoporphyrin O-methyltransferase